LNSTPLTMQPYTVGQVGQFTTFTLPQPLHVPDGQGFFAGISGPGGQTCAGVDTNLPLYHAAVSSPNGLNHFSEDPVNFMFRLLVGSPCEVQLEMTSPREFHALGVTGASVTGHSNCKPTADSEVDWIVINETNFVPETMVFGVRYTVEPNTSSQPRI